MSAMDTIVAAKKRLATAARKRYAMDADRARLQKQVGVENLAEARELFRSINSELEEAQKEQRILLRKIAKQLGSEENED